MFFPDERNKQIANSVITKNAGTTFLQHLNDDCLLELFSVKFLDLLDLCSLAETCLRFQHICLRIFPKELKIYILDDRFYVKSRNCVGRMEPFGNIERILKRFGKVVEGISFSSLKVSCHMRCNRLLRLVATYCGSTLRSLTIDDIQIYDTFTVILLPIFKRLELLDIRFGSVESDKLFSECDSLVDLRVYSVKYCNKILENNFPRLQRFTYQEQFTDMKESLSNFVSRHKNLTTLDLNTKTDGRLLHVMIEQCKGLRKLGINVRSRNVSSLSPLEALESLESLTIRTCEDFRFVPALTQLRELYLHNCSLPTDHYQLVSQFAQLTKLHSAHIRNVQAWFWFV